MEHKAEDIPGPLPENTRDSEGIVFVPTVEEFPELPRDVVLYPPNSGTPRAIVAWYQEALGTEPWPWKQGGWNNLGEALDEIAYLPCDRLVIKHHRLPSRLSEQDQKTYLSVLIEHVRIHASEPKHVVLVFPEKYRFEVERLLPATST